MRGRTPWVQSLSSIYCIALLCLGAGTASAQYRNLDAGRPSRIEDAAPTPLFALDIDLGPFQVERLSGGTMRYRAEPRLAFGVLPMTDIELRAPLVQVTPPNTTGSTSSAGLAGLSVGMMRALTIETTNVPAMAISAELSLPVGGLAPARGSYLAKGVLTKTTGLARVHLNAGFGTYAIYVAPPGSGVSSGCASVIIIAPGDSTCADGIPMIIDTPCSVSPRAPGALGTLDGALRRCMPPANQSVASVAPSLPTSGNRWFAGAAVDHSFPLQSVLVIADVYAERFIGLYPNTDWTAEAGLRYQLTPLLVLDVGAGRHFAGTIRSSLLTLGATYELATPTLFRR